MARPLPVPPSQPQQQQPSPRPLPTPTTTGSTMAPDASRREPQQARGEPRDGHSNGRERSGRGERRSRQQSGAAPSSPRYGSPLPATSAAAPSPPAPAHARPSSPASGGPSRHSHGNTNGGAGGRRHGRSAASGGDFDRSMPAKRVAPAGGDYDRSLPLKTVEPSPSSPSAPPARPYTGARGGPDPSRQLFDPRLHDPLRFVSPRGAATAPSVSGTSSTATTAPSLLHSTTTSGSVSTGLSSIHEGATSGKDKGDKERERRKRREGSERKSQRGDREDDTRSRSSEGSESLKDRARGKGGDTGVLGSLREQYRGIQALEAHLVDLHRRMGRDETIVLGTGATLGPGMADGGWVELCSRHMKLAHAHHDFLTASLDPRLPASLHSLPVKYNIAARLWQNSFHLLIERMRTTWLAPSSSLTRSAGGGGGNPASAVDGPSSEAAAASARALEHLTDYILDAYQFYTTLLDEQVLSTFRSAWIEALGDLARYRMAVANHVAQTAASTSDGAPSPTARFARIDDDEHDELAAAAAAAAPPAPSGNSIGKEVADAWDVEDRETWRTTARDWYALGVGEKPGEGRLHHRLALISRDVKGEEERSLYHFSKSLITNNPFAASRESILPLFDTALQSRRHHPDASAADLFVLLHGMLFTKIELDAFDDVFARFFERLQEDRVGTRSLGPTEWVMMGVINLAACLQFGAEDGLLKRAGSEDASARRPMRRDGCSPPATGANGSSAADAPQALMMHAGKRGAADPDGSDEGSDDVSPSVTSASHEGDIRPLQKPTAVSSAEDEEALPLPFRHALRLSFSVLSFCLAHPVRRDSLGRSIINPYITIMLTFLSTIAKQPAALALVERAVPWTSLVAFFNTVPRKVDVRLDVAPKITAGGPLPEDWCLRGMEWVGRRVYERGFWKQKTGPSAYSGRSYSGMPDGPRQGQAAITCEMDVLSQQVEQLSVEQQLHEGIIVDDADGAEAADLTARRWRRIAWSLAVLVKAVPGFAVDPDPAAGGRKVRVAPLGPLQLKIDGWAAERAALVEELRARIRQHEAGREAADGADDDDDEPEDDESDDDDEQDPEMKALKAQRRQLRAILRAGRQSTKPAGPSAVGLPGTGGRSAPARRHPARAPIPSNALRSALSGYTVLVFDTNVILSCLALFRAVVESACWTAMVPLPVITELDGLSKQPAPLGTQAQEALQFLTTHIRSHARSLKVQTSRGNYLADLAIRSEDISFSFSNTYNPEKARNMDDLILRACAFQAEHFVDRTAVFGVSRDAGPDVKDRAAKVVLLTNDRNLRLRAKAQGVMAVDEKPMRKMLGLAKDGSPAAAAGGG